MGSVTERGTDALKRPLRPLARPLLGRLGDLQLQINSQQERIDQIAQQLPILLNAIATQNATAREFERTRRAFEATLAQHGARQTSLDERLGAAEERLAAVDEQLATDGRLAATEERLATADKELVAAHERLTELSATLARIEARGELVRRELMYEMRYGTRSRGVELVEGEEVDLGSIASQGPLRLNLGSGHVPKEGYVNVDARKLDGVELVADVRKLPFDPGSVAEIYSSHLVEHFPLEELKRSLLPHWFELLHPGGQLVAIAPDAHAMVEETAAGRMPWDDFRRVTFGDQEYDGDFHFAMYTPESLAGLLTEVGFEGVEIAERARRNGLCYEFEIAARRPSDNGAAPDLVQVKPNAVAADE